MRKVVALVAAAAGAIVALGGERGEAAACTAKEKLKLTFPNVSAAEGLTGYTSSGTCADGSEVAYYYDEPGDDIRDGLVLRPENYELDFIIWLGDSDICSGDKCTQLCEGTNRTDAEFSGEVCKDVRNNNINGGLSEDEINEATARCLYSRVTCTSSWYSSFDEVTPQTLLCHDDPFFQKFKRVFIPACTLDWWLGRGTSPDAVGGKAASRHRGNLALRTVLLDLAVAHNLTYARRIVIGGTRGGAVGLLNNLDEIKSILSSVHAELTGQADTVPRKVLSVLDSAWFYNTEAFAVADEPVEQVLAFENFLVKESADWLPTARLNPDCLARWGSSEASKGDRRHNCLFPSNLITHMKNESLLFVQSLYDLVQLESLGLLEEDATEDFVDTASYASAAISYIETYGEMVRSDMERAAAVRGSSDEHHFYATACGQHGYIVPTSIHTVDPRTEQIGTFGSVQFQRNQDVWENVRVNGVSVRESIVAFIESDGTNSSSFETRGNLLADECGSFLCNTECTTKIIPYQAGQIETLGTKCWEFLTIGYGLSVLVLFYIGFFLSGLQVLRFRRTVNAYWKRVKLIEEATGNKDDQVREVQQQLLNEAASAEYRKIHLMVEGLSYWAPAKTRRGKPFKILESVDLTFAPGRVHAIMGPSGSGKSTLLDILALTRDSGNISGAHYINGVPSDSASCKFLREWMRHNSSYVRQSDVLFPLLTVREHLVHAAWLMLPQYMSAEAKLRRVWQVMRLLELDECGDTQCGDGGITVEGGISGGQRRRVSVATQLLKMPAVLLLDEPTSGLDSTNALLLVKALHTFAHEGGVNVLMTIHQPRKEIFSHLDSLSFLVQGRVVFSGAAEAAAMHFRLPANSTNIANDILDVLQTCEPARIKDFESAYANGPLGDAVREEMEAEATELTTELITNLKEVLVENSLAEGRWSWSESSSSAMLSWVLMSRSFRRGGFDLMTTTSLALVGGTLVGIVFIGTDTYTSRTALAYLVVATMTFLQGTFLGDRYLGEKQMYDHETDAGTFRSWVAFLISQFLRDCVASSVEGIAFAAPVYWVGGMNPAIERFGLYMLIMVLTSFVVLCQNVFIEVDRDDLRTAAMLQIGLLGLGALFNGFIIKLDDIPDYLSWVPYIMVTYWSFVGTIINDLSGFVVPVEKASVLERAARTGDVIIQTLSYDDRNVYICILVLVIFVVVFRGLAVLDFYLRYVLNRGNTLNRVSDDAEKSKAGSPAGGRTPLLRQGSGAGGSGKNTMNAMLEAQTPTMKRQESGLNRSDSSMTAGTPRSTPNLGGRQGAAGSVSAFNLSPGAPSSPSTALPEVEMAYYADEEVKLSFVQSRLSAILLDRNLFFLFFLVDFYSSAYLCEFEFELTSTSPSDVVVVPIALAVTSALVSGIYVLFFFYQLFALIPTTLDGKLDCTWAGGYDAVGALTLIVDVALVFQATGTAAEFTIQLVLAGIVRVMRFLRVYAYWQKVDAYHAVRARSFLDLRDELIEEVAEANVGGERRISGFDDFSGGPRVQQLPPSRPARPARPARPNFNRPAANMQGSVPAALRMQHSSIQRMSLKRASNRQSGTFPPSRPPPPTRPVMLSRRFGRAAPLPPQQQQEQQQQQQRTNPAELGDMWRPLGNGYVYNPYTGQTLSMNQIAQRRAPPPPPPPSS